MSAASSGAADRRELVAETAKANAIRIEPQRHKEHRESERKYKIDTSPQ